MPDIHTMCQYSFYAANVLERVAVFSYFCLYINVTLCNKSDRKQRGRWLCIFSLFLLFFSRAINLKTFKRVNFPLSCMIVSREKRCIRVVLHVATKCILSTLRRECVITIFYRLFRLINSKVQTKIISDMWHFSYIERHDKDVGNKRRKTKIVTLRNRETAKKSLLLASSNHLFLHTDLCRYDRIVAHVCGT